MDKDFIKVAMPFVGNEEIEAVREVLLSGQYASGSKVAEFENAFAVYNGSRYAVAVNSGTSALYIALEAMGIRKGDEVIVPPLTFFATVSSVLYIGAKPVFADINNDDLCLSPQSVQEKITENTKAIIPVHLFGASAKMGELLNIAESERVFILEDCAQAHGTEYKDQKVGSIGKAGAFSFFATKHMTTGEGGMITTDDMGIADKCKIIRNHGMEGRDDHVRLGFNNRMTEIEAAIGLVQLKKLDELNYKRIENSEYLIENLKQMSWAKIPVHKTDVKHTYFWCPLMVEEKSGKTIEELKKHLKDNGIGFRHRYSEPLYKQPVLKKLGFDYTHLHLKNVESIAGQVIGLPNHPGLGKDKLDRIIEVLGSF